MVSYIYIYRNMTGFLETLRQDLVVFIENLITNNIDTINDDDGYGEHVLARETIWKGGYRQRGEEKERYE